MGLLRLWKCVERLKANDQEVAVVCKALESEL